MCTRPMLESVLRHEAVTLLSEGRCVELRHTSSCSHVRLIAARKDENPKKSGENLRKRTLYHIYM